MTRLIAGKDLRTLWASPLPWVVGAAFHVVLGLLYVDQVAARGQALIQPLFPIAGFLVLLTVPLLTMRVFAEESRSGTLDLLQAIPISSRALVLGKWLASWLTATVVVAPSLAAALVLRLWGAPDWGPVLSGYLGLVLLAGTATAIGVLASALTSSQAVAAMVAMFVGLLLWLADFGASSPLAGLLLHISVRETLRGFASGAIDSADTVTFAVMAVAAIGAAIVALDVRRVR